MSPNHYQQSAEELHSGEFPPRQVCILLTTRNPAACSSFLPLFKKKKKNFRQLPYINASFACLDSLRNTVSLSMRMKLAAHCLALLLHMGDQTANLTLLHRDMSISEAK